MSMSLGYILVAVVAGVASPPWAPYRRLGASDVPFEGAVISRFSSAAAAEASCTATAGCAAFAANSSDGASRTLSRVGCEWGQDFCIYPHGATEYVTDVDLFVKTGSTPPDEWRGGIAAGTVLYAQPEPDLCMMPDVGNGYVASIVGFASMHVSGFFAGGCGGVAKAHLPSVVAISATNAVGNQTQAGLDIARGMYVRRLHVAGSDAVVEQRTYAHRVRMHIMVTEFELVAGTADDVTLELETLYDPLCGPPPPPPPSPPEPAFNGTYLKVSQDSGPNGHDVGNDPACQTGSCAVERLKAECDNNPRCDMFQTHGFFKACPEGVSTNATTACFARTPWPSEDAYYKVRSAPCMLGTPLPGPTGGSGAGDTDAGEPRPAAQQPPVGTPAFGEGQPCSTAGAGCAGHWSQNVAFYRLDTPTGFGHAVAVFVGNTTVANETGQYDHAAIVSRVVPATLTLHRGTVERFAAAVTATVAQHPGYDPVAHALAEYGAAMAPANASTLLSEHVASWAKVWADGGIEVLGVADDGSGRALDIQSHLNSAFYYMVTSIREDWAHGALNPGGLASDNYDTVFFDMEFYMEPALLWFWPSLARTLTEFRFEGLAAAYAQASVFGWKGAQFPWCTVSFGRSSGCCSGSGGFELCLEQHITPDVGFAMQQFYRWTGDKGWLAAIGFPIARGVAEWVASRVTRDPSGAYHLEKVMPVDEWCDNAASGCGSRGVNDDPQMNGAAIAALQFAIEAATALGAADLVDPAWLDIANNLALPIGSFSTPWGSYVGVHLMPNRTVPFATYMEDGRSTVCPEDVMYLSYPMGPALNISAELTARDLDAWVGSGLTCLENGGMTHPIHIVTYLLAQTQNASYRELAEVSLNGTMYGVCYGPFNLRNEVDRHTSTVGAHYSNTHFVTGDGGFVNAFVSGFGGIMLGADQAALRLTQPTVPERTGGLRFNGLKYLGGNFDYSFTAAALTFTIHAGTALCLVGTTGAPRELAVGKATTIPMASVAFPASLGPCT